MSKVKLENYMSEINDLPEGVEIVIPSGDNKITFIIVSVVLLVLIILFLKNSIVLFILSTVQGLEIFSKIFTILWLFILGYACYFLLSWLVWCVKGKYIIRTDGIELQSMNNFFLFLSRSKEYGVSDIKNLRVIGPMERTEATNTIDFTKYSISFDYGRKVIGLAYGLDEMEANYLVNTLKNRYNSFKF